MPAAPREREASPAPERPRAAPSHERSRIRPEQIDLRIIGALLDYPELLDSEALLAYSGSMQGDLALAIAVLRKARPTAGPGAAQAASFTAALAKMPEAIRPFALARLAAPVHLESSKAADDLMANLKKMQRQDFSRHHQSVVGDIARARSEGDQDTEFELLRSLEARARKRRDL